MSEQSKDSGLCHPECTIGPNTDHHGTMSYRCMDERGNGLPFPGESSVLVDLGGGYVYRHFEREDSAPEQWAVRHDDPGRPVSPSTAALNLMATKVSRVRDEIAEWRDDDSEQASAWGLAADIIAGILDGEQGPQ